MIKNFKFIWDGELNLSIFKFYALFSHFRITMLNVLIQLNKFDILSELYIKFYKTGMLMSSSIRSKMLFSILDLVWSGKTNEYLILNIHSFFNSKQDPKRKEDLFDLIDVEVKLIIFFLLFIS